MSFSKTKLYAADQRIRRKREKNSKLQQLHCDCEKN